MNEYDDNDQSSEENSCPQCQMEYEKHSFNIFVESQTLSLNVISCLTAVKNTTDMNSDLHPIIESKLAEFIKSLIPAVKEKDTFTFNPLIGGETSQ